MQSKKHSFFETLFGTVAGFLIGWAVNYLVLPMYGFNVSSNASFQLTLIFTLVSIIRMYFVRRFFNWLHRRQILEEVKA